MNFITFACFLLMLHSLGGNCIVYDFSESMPYISNDFNTTRWNSETYIRYIEGSDITYIFTRDSNNNSPLDQFVIVVLITLALPFAKFCITNMGLYLGITTIIIIATGLLALNNSKAIANYWSICVESLHATIHNIVISQINNKTGQSYYPFMYSLFMLILISNLIGMIPYCLASTSHFSFSFSLSFSIVLGCTILGFFLHKLVFFSLLVPEGCPLGLLFLLVLIEFISYLARAVSLGLRLAANILSGHMLLNILSSFTYKIMKQGSTQSVASILPSVFVTAFTVLEIGICFIQAQVYVVLSSSYISNAIRLH